MRWVEVLKEGIYLNAFEELARKCDTVEQFIQKTDGMDVLYRGHSGEEITDHSFFTDYIGHAEHYGETIDAFAFDPQDVMFFNDARFDEMRRALKRMTGAQLAATYKVALIGNRFADNFADEFTAVRRVIRSDTPYSKISGDFGENDKLIPLMQKWARDHGKNIIAFLGSDYVDYGGQNEYVVGDLTKLVNLRKLYYAVK